MINKEFLPRIYIPLIALNVIIILFGSGFFGLIHNNMKHTSFDYMIKSYIWISVLLVITGFTITYKKKNDARQRLILMSFFFILAAGIPALFPLRCSFMVPGPVCSLVKPILFVRGGLTDFPVKFSFTLALILSFSVLGNKIFCSFACPIGLLQDAIHFIPSKRKKIKLNFYRTNSVRVLLFIVLITVLIFTGTNIYFSYLNPFGPLRWQLRADPLVIAGWIVLFLTVSASFFTYRPYCYTICPIGLITWLLESISMHRVRFDKTICNDCRTCITETDCPSVEALVAGKKIRPDCFSCGQCIEKCPTGALRYGIFDRIEKSESLCPDEALITSQSKN